MNILTIKEGGAEMTLNVDRITYMELIEGKTTQHDKLVIDFMGTSNLLFEGRSARPIQFEIDMLMAKVAKETAIVELVSS